MDATGTVLCHNAGPDDLARCSLAPTGEELLAVTVKNNGTTTNRYFLTLN